MQAITLQSLSLLFVILNLYLIISYIRIRNREKILNKSMDLFKIFHNSSENLMYIKDENFKYIYINNAVENFHQKSEHDILGKTDFDITDFILADKIRKNDLDVISEKTVEMQEIKWKSKVFRTRKFPVKLPNDYYGIGAYIEDITEEYKKIAEIKSMKSSLEKSNALLLSIIESSPEIIVYAIDNEYRYLSFNKRHKETMLELWGKDIYVGMSILDVAEGHEDGIRAKANYDRVLTGESFNMIEKYGNENLVRFSWQNYYAPIYSQDKKIIGLTCFAINITQRIIAEEQTKYYCYHDPITGLYNTRFMQGEIKRLDVEKNLPFSVIMGDLNGLKLTNDVFGHKAGDYLLKKVSSAIKLCCREDDIVGRVGGDEFAILLPNTNELETHKIMKRIEREVANLKLKFMIASIALGSATKSCKTDKLSDLLKIAEEEMYLNKSMRESENHISKLNHIIEELHRKSKREKLHSHNVSIICEKIANELNLPLEEVKKIRDSGYYHDIGKIILDDTLLNKIGDEVSEDEKSEIKKHSTVGYRILNLYSETVDIAKGALEHHEYWNGKGYPKGLRKDEISLVARIIAVAEGYDFLTNSSGNLKLSKESAMNEIINSSGVKYDPKIVEAFTKVI